MEQEIASLFLGDGESPEQVEKLLDSITDLVQSVRPDGSFAYVNRAWRETLGYSAARIDRLKVFDVIHESSRDKCRGVFERLLSGQTVPPFETVFVKSDGGLVELEGNASCSFEGGRPVLIRAVLRDVSERRRFDDERRQIEEQMRHAQKLESLGVLAGGIAHDFNNLLTVIIGSAELAKSHVAPTSPAGPLLTSLETAARRAAELTREMLAYAGRAPIVRETCDVSALVLEMSQLLATVISKRTRLELNLDAAPALVDGDPTQIRQVVMNLITNASESYDDRAGTIHVRTSVMHATADFLQSPYIAHAPQPGSYVCVEVGDAGCGMADEILPRIFDPFFTTKFIGRGLGLAATLGIVRGHRGTIHVTSGLGLGTTVRVLFPLAAGYARTYYVPPASPDPWTGSGRLLVVDDEEAVRDVATEMLTAAGFEVVTASDGEEAVRLLRAEPREIRAVLLDLTMPTPALDALADIQRVRAGVPVVLMSGYTREDVSGRFPDRPWADFLQKPFAAAELRRVLRRVLDPA